MKGRVRGARQNVYCVFAWKRKGRGSENLATPDTNFQPTSYLTPAFHSIWAPS